jgi:hypothetical protein
MFNGHPFVAHTQKRQHGMKAKKFEEQFDDGIDLTPSLNLSKAKPVLQEQKQIDLDSPTEMTDTLNQEIESRVAAYHCGEMKTYALEDVLAQAQRIAP